MSIHDEFATDQKKEIEGAKISLSPNKDGTIPAFFVAATVRTNSKYQKALEAATKPYRGNISAMGNEGAEKLYRKVFIDTILKGWEHVQDEKGNEISFSKESAEALFIKYPRLYDKLQSEAGDIENFKEAQQEIESGN